VTSAIFLLGATILAATYRAASSLATPRFIFPPS